MTLLPESDNKQPPTWTLIRDIAVLQVKLLVDGARDLILVPASLIAGLVSLVKSQDGKPGPQFYTLVGVGKQEKDGRYTEYTCKIQNRLNCRPRLSR
jgi:hypothetical protein